MRGLEAKIKLKILLREWRKDKKITVSDYNRARRIISPNSPRGKTYTEIYGVKKAISIKHKARFARSSRALFEKSRTLGIIRALYKKPRFIRNLREEAGGSNSTIISRTDALEETGFVVTSYETTYPFRRVVTLTQKGERLARDYLGATGSPSTEID